MQQWTRQLSWWTALSMTVAGPALAQRSAVPAKNYPSKPIRIVVPFPPGGPVDFVARTTGQKLTASLGQPIVVDNRPGAAGIIGAELVAKSAPDGYTLLLTTGTMSTTPFFYKKLPYDTVRDFLPVTMVARNTGHVLVVNPNVPARSVKELIALAKANPGKLNYGAPGYGNTLHLVAELFNVLADVKTTLIQYKGTAPALTDLVSGQIDMFFPDVQTSLPLIQAGRIRAVAVTSTQRLKQLPDVPTLDESGLKGYKFYGWFALWFPGATPVEYVVRIQGAVASAVKDPEVIQRFDELGLESVGSKPEEFAKFFAEDRAFYKDLTTKIGAVPQ